MDVEARIKLFGMSTALIERDLDLAERSLSIDLQREQGDERDESYYPQFDEALRVEAASMREHYELFYCLERTIRRLIAEILEGEHGVDWWKVSVPETIQASAAENMKREIDSGVTPRSENELDFTTFGELGEIVRKNWTSFGGTFSSEKAFTGIMTRLNTLRSPIAHCCPLAKDEVVRLQLTVSDWFRLME